MPHHELTFPIGAYNIKLKKAKSDVTYLASIPNNGFTRTGEDGSIGVLSLFGGDEFNGEILEGQWQKWWDTEFDNSGGVTQPFTAIVNTTNHILEMEGETDDGVTYQLGVGTLISNGIMPLMDELEFTIAMKVPIDDTGSTADRDIQMGVYLVRDYEYNQNPYQNNMINWYLDVTESGFRIVFSKRINGVNTFLHRGPDADTNDATYSTGDLEACIIRFVFNDADPDASYPQNKKHMHVYLKQSDTFANAEAAEEKELVGSPYDISDLYFDMVYPAIWCASQQQTYYDDAEGTAQFDYLRVEYPEIEVSYDCDIDDQLGNEVELWDGDPDSGGIKVYDKDHKFSSDIYLQNGLVRAKIRDGIYRGLSLYLYLSGYTGSWDLIDPYLRNDTTNLRYPFFMNIDYIGPEKIILKIKLRDTATENNDYFVVHYLTLKRGSLSFEFEILDVYPMQPIGWTFYDAGQRFGYAGNDEFSDADLSDSGNNYTLSDNFLIGFDPDTNALVYTASTETKPTSGSARFQAYWGANLYIQDIAAELVIGCKVWLAMTPYSLITALFEEAENATYGNGASVELDGLASNGQAVMLEM